MADSLKPARLVGDPPRGRRLIVRRRIGRAIFDREFILEPEQTIESLFGGSVVPTLVYDPESIKIEWFNKGGNLLR